MRLRLGALRWRTHYALQEREKEGGEVLFIAVYVYFYAARKGGVSYKAPTKLALR